MSPLLPVLFPLVLWLGVHGARVALVQVRLDDRAALDSADLSASEFLQQVQVLAPIPPPVPPGAQAIGMHQQEGPSQEVPWVHWVDQREVHSVDYDPAAPLADLYWVEVHVVADLSVSHLPPRLHLPMHPEEPCYRKVSAHLSK